MLISLEQAASFLTQGKVVAIPTDTVYGLAGSINHIEALEQIYSLKNRPKKNPLIIHISHYSQCDLYLEKKPPDFERLAHHFWPGPLTLIVKIRPYSIHPLVTAGLKTAAFRLPAHPLCIGLINMVGPLAAPSANLSGKPSSTQSHHIEHDFGKDFPILDGGVCGSGLESTILAYTTDQWQIARLGTIPAEAFAPLLGYQPQQYKASSHQQLLCPGQIYRHYAPQARLIIDPKNAQACSIIVGFSDRSYPQSSKVFILGSSNAPEEVAHNLYSTLRALDNEQIDVAWIDTYFPETGLWTTIRERIFKAAAASGT